MCVVPAWNFLQAYGLGNARCAPPTANTLYQAQPMVVSPMMGRMRSAAVANLRDVVVAQLLAAEELGELRFSGSVVDVIIASDAPGWACIGWPPMLPACSQLSGGEAA